MTTHPKTRPVLPVRNASASSMRSPPASAEATRVSIWSPGFARPGASPRSTWLSTSCAKPRCRARATRRSSPALATRRQSSEGNCSDLRGSADYSAYCKGATEHGISTANRFRPLKREQLRQKRRRCGQDAKAVASIECSSSGVGFVVQKPLSPKPGALSDPLSTPPQSSFRWIGAKAYSHSD